MSRRLLLFLVAALAVLATGCLKVDVAIDVNDDGSGAIRTVQAVDVDALAQSGAAGFEPGDLLPDRGDLPERVSAARYRQDGYEGVELRAEFQDLDELDSRLQDVTDAFVATFEVGGAGRGSRSTRPPGDALAGFRIARTVDGWTFVGDGLAGEIGTPDLRALAGGADLRLQVRLPGRPLPGRHNADEVDGNTFVWQLGAADPRDELFAETGPGSPGSSDGRWLWAALMVGFAAAATVTVVWLARRHHQPPMPRPPRAPKPPRPAPRPVAPRVLTKEEAVPVDASGWPRHPPPQPPLLPPSPWSSGATFDPPVSWSPGGPPRPGGPGGSTGVATPITPVRPAADPASAPAAAPAPAEIEEQRPATPPPAAPTPAAPTPAAPTPAAGPPATAGDDPPPRVQWEPPPGWPFARPPSPAGSGTATSAGEAAPGGLTLPPRRPVDLPGSPASPGDPSP